jgi:hypothetical protein
LKASFLDLSPAEKFQFNLALETKKSALKRDIVGLNESE